MLKYVNTAKQIWEGQEEGFGKESDPHAYELKHTLTLKRQDKASIYAYYTKLQGLLDEIQSVSLTPRCTYNSCTCEASKRMIEAKEKEHLLI